MMNFVTLLLALTLPVFAWAQESKPETTTKVETPAVTPAENAVQAPVEGGQPLDMPKTDKNGKIEKIEVTGSYIKRINVEGPSPILTIDRESMQRSGYNSVADVLRDSTLTATGVVREQAGGGLPTSGAAVAGLRGFGPDKVLVLLNGQRLPKLGGQNSVDLNLIPFQALERVEILKDGASAVYGSDALAGVINFITKKDYDGSSVSMRYSAPEDAGGVRQDISAIWGKNYSSGNIMAIYQYRNNEELFDRQRPWSNGNGQPLSPSGSPGSFRPANDIADGGADDDSFQPATNCPGNLNLSSGSNTFCGFDYTPFSWALPAIEQHTALLAGEVELNSSMRTYTTLTYTNRQSRWQFAPAPDTFRDDSRVGGSNFELPGSLAGVGPGQWGINTGGEPFDLQYRLVSELGPRANRDTTDSYGGTIGLKGYVGDTWDWDFAVTHGATSTHNVGHAGYADKNVLYQGLLNGDFIPDIGTAAPVFNLPNAFAISEQRVNSSITSAQFIANGEVTNVGDGILSAAVGTSASWEDYHENVDDVTLAGNLFGGVGSQGQASRNYQALFGELGLSFQNLEFQLAGRFDRYSDFGETFNPKFSFRYLPTQSIMFRGSVGTGFRAPTLDELYSAAGFGFPWYVDQKACAAAGGTGSICRPQQYQTFSGGNSNLQEETSLSWNLGTVIQPSRDFNITMDYWNTTIDNAIGITLTDVMTADARGIPLPPGIQVNRNGSGNIDTVIAPQQNLATQIADGIDVSTSYRFRLGSVDFIPSMNHSHFLSYMEEPLPGLGMIDKLDWAGRPRWRNNITLTTNFLQSHSIRVSGRTLPGQFKEAHTANQADERRMSLYTEYDINYRWNTFWDGQLSFGVRNLFGTDRPLDDTAGFSDRLNSSLYDPLGRLYYVGYTQNF